MMNLLLDTHTAIWAVSDSDRLPHKIGSLLTDRSNRIYVSAASIWEIAIKYSLGKKSAPPFSGARAIEMFTASNYTTMDITPQHAAAVGNIKLPHGDPFDKLILAQALTEPMRLVTHDRILAGYDPIVISW